MKPASHAEDEEWLDYRKRFADTYDASNYESPVQSRVMHASHRLVERPFDRSSYFDKVLEIGAGTGEHVEFVRHRFGQYTVSDSDPKALDVAKSRATRPSQGTVKFELQDGGELDCADGSFDRVIATHVLEHIYRPHLALKEWRRVLKDGGMLSILIPTDPGIAWRFGRRLGPRRNAIARGIEYDYVMAREHVNSCHNLIVLLRYYFHDVRESWWPLSLRSIDLNLFIAFHAVVRK